MRIPADDIFVAKLFLATETAPPPPAPPAEPTYFQLSRDLAVSLILTLPLLVLYQAGLYLMGYRVINGADLFTRTVYPEWGAKGLVLFNLVLTAAVLVAIIKFERRGRFRPSLLVPLVFEGLIYASVLGTVIIEILRQTHVVSLSTVALGQDPSLRAVVLSLGAGVNEEIVFRLALIPVLEFIFGDFIEWSPRVSATLAVVISALLFAGAHHIGAHGEELRLSAFAYRAVAGVIFAVLYRVRGFAVAAYTHAIYDVLVLVPAAQQG